MLQKHKDASREISVRKLRMARIVFAYTQSDLSMHC